MSAAGEARPARDRNQAAELALEAEAKMRTLRGPELIDAATWAILDTQGRLAELSGLPASAITALKRGRRPTAAERAALAWAVFRRWA